MTGVDELRSLSLFAGLDDDQLADLIEGGEVVRIEPTVELFREGEPADFWWVLLDGAIDLVRHIDREDTVVARMDAPGRWAGGFRAWDQQGVYLATGRGVITGRVLRVPADVLRDRSNAWFPFAAHLVEGLYHTARLIESTARQRESLVTLGTLAAGLAHELNNPASAATRAVDELEAASQTMLASAERLIRGGISAERFAALDALRREIEPGTAPQDPIKVADREEVLSSWLVGHDVAREWVIAPVLAAAGVDVAWCERAATVLTESALEPGLEWVSSALSVASLLSEVKGSTRRVSELVAALRSYSQMDRAAIQLVDITDGIESTLAVLGHRLTDNISVVRDYGDRGPSDRGLRGRAQPGMDKGHRERAGCDGRCRYWNASHPDASGRRVPRRRDQRHGNRDVVCSRGPSFRCVLHDEAGREGRRARPRHRPTDCQ